MNTQWYDITQQVANHPFGVVQQALPMVRYHDGRVARVNTPPAGVTPRTAAVLVIVTPYRGSVALVLTRRGGHLREHGGEIAFPGGRLEADETAPLGALREAHEELGIVATTLAVIGQLHAVYVPRSNHMVTPVVAWSATLPTLIPNPSEVAEAFLAPLSDLLPEHAVAYEERDMRGERVVVPYFLVQHHRIWGATALIICDLVARIRAFGQLHPHTTRTMI